MLRFVYKVYIYTCSEPLLCDNKYSLAISDRYSNICKQIITTRVTIPVVKTAILTFFEHYLKLQIIEFSATNHIWRHG